VNQVGLDEKPSGTFITVYPNPTSGDLTVKMPSVKGRTDLEVTDLSGKVIYKRSNIKESQWNFTLKAPAGVYFVKVTSDENVFVERVIKE
jgi:hypothetical protein